MTSVRGERIVGIGLDAVELDRFRRALERTPRIRQRLFSEREQRYADRRVDPTERYAARFAAKEAVMKALGVGMFAFNYLDVEVIKAPSGQPSLRVVGKAAELAAARGVIRWELTITHTERTAQAIALAIGEA
jgi:holo-[acyl-carrier protein] synthase